MIHRPGEASLDGQLRIGEIDDTELAVTFLPTGEQRTLRKRETVEFPTWFARMQLELSGESPFFVRLGDTFRLNRNLKRVWRLVRLEEGEAKISEVKGGATRVIKLEAPFVE